MIRMIIFLFISVSLFAIDITGSWKLSNEHPFHFCSLIGYDTLLRFNINNTIDKINSRDIHAFQSTKMIYTLKNDKLNVYLDNKGIGVISSFMLKHSSANQTFNLKPLNEECFKAIQSGQENNSFTMCKIK